MSFDDRDLGDGGALLFDRDDYLIFGYRFPVGIQMTFHSWRLTFRTRLSEAGVSDDLAKRLGGWIEDATAARYDHAERIAELREAIEKVA
jgi:integrase